MRKGTLFGETNYPRIIESATLFGETISGSKRVSKRRAVGGD
jgi:hypothetical protein